MRELPRHFVVVVVVALLAIGCRKDRDQRADDALAYISADSQVVVGFNIKELREGPLWEALAPKLEADAEYQDIKKGCGFDPIAGIDHVVIGLTELRPTPSGVFVIKGKQVGKLLGCDIGGKVKREGKTVFYEDEHGEAVLALADDATLVGAFGFSPSKRDLDAALAKSASLKSSEGFKELFSEISTGHTVWFAGKGSLLDDAGIGLVPRSFGGSMDIGNRVTLAGVARFGSTDDANRATKLLRDAFASGEARIALESSDVEQDNTIVKGSVTMSSATTKMLLKDAASDGW